MSKPKIYIRRFTPEAMKRGYEKAGCGKFYLDFESKHDALFRKNSKKWARLLRLCNELNVGL